MLFQEVFRSSGRPQKLCLQSGCDGLLFLAMASNLGCLVLLVLQFLVTNLLAMAPQPAFDGI